MERLHMLHTGLIRTALLLVAIALMVIGVLAGEPALTRIEGGTL